MDPSLGEVRHLDGSSKTAVAAHVGLRVDCGHNQYRSIVSSYDARAGVLAYFWRCDRCGAILGEAGRLRYRPHYDPRGNERCSTAARERPVAQCVPHSRLDRFEHAHPTSVDLPDAPGAYEEVDVPKHL